VPSGGTHDAGFAKLSASYVGWCFGRGFSGVGAGGMAS